ncbi:hypothetical protein [Rhizobium sp. BR 317]|uniref:hypothetical protein n=1 Tax=Rhizobium sp. BR 317 TaxID=3040015 RepID=UPI0039BF2486
MRLYALRHWRDLCFPREIVIADEEQQYEPECAIEIRPSEAELLRAVGRKVIGRERWYHTGEMANVYDDAPAPDIEYRTNRNGALEASIGGLMFRDGELKQWGTTRKGAALQPDERRRGVKGGGVKPGRTETAIWDYIRLKGAVSPLTAKPYSKPLSSEPAIGDCYTPSADVVDARKLLKEFGVDGSVPFDQLPFRATSCEDGLVAGPQWVGGVKKPKPLGEISSVAGREPDFVRHVETVSYVDYLRHRLGKHAKVLDLAITDATAKEIGMSAGHAPAYAEKRGPSIIDAAIDALIELDETARGEFKNSQTMEEKIAA